MPWVVFTENFNWTPASDRRQTTGYKAGHKVLVTRACAQAAAGRFKPTRVPNCAERPLVNTREAIHARLEAAKSDAVE